VDDIAERVTELLQQVDLANPEESDELLRLVYDDLRALAARQMRGEHGSRTLQPTALVHEAYLRLADGGSLKWASRSHFFRVVARAMRQVLVDQARRRNAGKRGGDWQRVTLESNLLADTAEERGVLELHEALARLGELDPALERLVELRFFGGLTVEEAAATLGVSPRKAAKDWAAARLWLSRELAGG
jgi:RNA polymerase sigma-70 factor, ECF subfamily